MKERILLFIPFLLSMFMACYFAVNREYDHASFWLLLAILNRSIFMSEN